MSWPKISIVMPVLNRVDVIEKALQSILAQQYENLELIVIDGGSVDGTLEIINKYAPYISYFQSKKDSGPSAAMNTGIQKATGDVIAFLMADDWYEPGIFKKVAECLIAHPEVEVVSCGGQIVFRDDATGAYHPEMIYDKEKQLRLNFYNVCFAVSAICCRFIRKSVYRKLSPILTHADDGFIMLSSDKEFLLRVILSHPKEKFIPMIGHTYLSNPNSSTFGHNKNNILRLCHEHKQIARKFLKEKGVSMREKFLLHYWYTDQTTRLMMYSVIDKDYKTLREQSVDGLKRYPFTWPFTFMFNAIKITLKRLRKKSVFS